MAQQVACIAAYFPTLDLTIIVAMCTLLQTILRCSPQVVTQLALCLAAEAPVPRVHDKGNLQVLSAFCRGFNSIKIIWKEKESQEDFICMGSRSLNPAEVLTRAAASWTIILRYCNKVPNFDDFLTACHGKPLVLEPETCASFGDAQQL